MYCQSLLFVFNYFGFIVSIAQGVYSKDALKTVQKVELDDEKQTKSINKIN